MCVCVCVNKQSSTIIKFILEYICSKTFTLTIDVAVGFTSAILMQRNLEELANLQRFALREFLTCNFWPLDFQSLGKNQTGVIY